MELLLDIAEMTEGVREDLETIRETRGRACTLEEARELLDLQRAVKRAYDGRPDRDGPDRDGMLPRSIQVGDATVHSLTIAGRIMLRRLLAWNGATEGGMFDQDTWDVANAWVFAHCHDRAAMSLCTPEAVSEAALDWSANLTCPTAELDAAIDTLTTGAAPAVEPGGETPDDADTVRALSAALGGTPDHWMYDAPESMAAHMIDAMNRAAMREAAAMARAAGKSVPPDADQKLKAMGRYDDAYKLMIEDTDG